MDGRLELTFGLHLSLLTMAIRVNLSDMLAVWKCPRARDVRKARIEESG